MDAGDTLAVIVVLAIAIAAIYYIVKRQRPPTCPPAPTAVSFWATTDGSSVPTGIVCPAGSTIAVQNADYGAPWSGCGWLDVSPRASALMDGSGSYTIPGGQNLTALLGVADHCGNTSKTFAGSYVCLPPRPQ